MYFDAAASSLKPNSVIDAEMDFLKNHYANAGRGVCARTNSVDAMVANTRKAVADFINAAPEQIVFTSGTTDGMNRIPNILNAASFMYSLDDKIIMASDLDHHSARMPFENHWHVGKSKFVLCPLDSEFNLDEAAIPYADVFVITAMSNVLGMPQDVKKIITAARAKNPKCITIVDAAQYVAYLPIDVNDWDCDFLCFSGHKIGSDTGIGIMYIKQPRHWWSDKFGGGMIKKITGAAPGKVTWSFEEAPAKFEAGTLPLTQIAGLLPAIKECTEHRAQSTDILKYLHYELSKIDRIKIITKPDAHILSFTVDGMHVMDFGAMTGAYGVCLRVGDMCASWLHRLMGIDGTIRISAGFWNTMDEAKELVSIIKKIIK